MSGAAHGPLGPDKSEARARALGLSKPAEKFPESTPPPERKPLPSPDDAAPLPSPPVLDVIAYQQRSGAWAARARGAGLEATARGYGTPGQAAHAAVFALQARLHASRWRQDAPGRLERAEPAR